MKRTMYFALGWFFFSLGLIGAFLPVMPTVVFMIMALWAFSKSSQRFHDWLYHHRLFGPPLQQWQQYRVIPVFAKVVAIVCMSGSAIYLLTFSQVPRWIVVGVCIVFISASVYILSKPSRRPVEQAK